MTCLKKINHKYFFVVGDPFNLPMRLTDTDSLGNVVGINVASLVEVTAKLFTSKGHFVCDLVVVPYSNQVINPGWFYLQYLDTSKWLKGMVGIRVKVEFSNTSKQSSSFEFELI